MIDSPDAIFYLYKVKSSNHNRLLLSFSERAGIRTPDNLIKSQVLYHLSYTPLNWGSWTRTSGAGVRILCLTTWRYPINATARLYYHMFPTTVNTFFEFF